MGKRTAAQARHRAPCRLTCDRPPAWCEAHHIIAWADGGPTDITNLCLLCTYHHRNFHTRGWTVHMTNGTPEWLPPPWLDPTQRPRRNHTHHPPDIRFPHVPIAA